MKKGITLTQKLLIFVSIFFILATLDSWFFLYGIKGFNIYAEINHTLNSIKNNIVELEYVLDIYVIGGYYEGVDGTEGIYDKADSIDKQIGSLKGLSDIESIMDDPMMYTDYKTIISDWNFVKEKTALITATISKENAFLIHNDIDLKTFLIKEQLDRIGKFIADKRAKVSSNIHLMVIKGLLLSVFIALVGLYIFYYKVIKPIKDMAATAMKIRGGDLSVRFKAVTTNDEVGILANTLNNMADAVNEAHTMLEKKISDKTRELETKTRELVSLNRIANSIGRTFSHDEILNIAMNELLLISAASAGWMYISEPRNSNNKGQRLILKAHRGLPDSFLREFKELALEDITMGQTMRGNGYIFVDVKDINYKFRTFLEDIGAKSLCIIPITYVNNIVGVINLVCNEDDSVVKGHCMFAEAVAGEVAIALENINLFQKERKSKQFMEKLIHQSPISVEVFDKNGLCIMINSAYKRLFGIQDETRIVGRYNIFKDNVLEEGGYMSTVNKVLRGESVDMEIEYDISKVLHIQVAGKPKKLKIKMFPILDNDGSITNMVIMREPRYTQP